MHLDFNGFFGNVFIFGNRFAKLAVVCSLSATVLDEGFVGFFSSAIVLFSEFRVKGSFSWWREFQNLEFKAQLFGSRLQGLGSRVYGFRKENTRETGPQKFLSSESRRCGLRFEVLGLGPKAGA